ncbi:MAG: hypothetical protein EXS35_17620 [Pedosphaera sp.]|nr:hypothetical protein [Pedosphaera sp.]
MPVWYHSIGLNALAKTIEVVRLNGKELAGTNARELRQSAWRLAKESGFLRQRFKNKDTGWEIYVNRKSLEHGFANQGLVNILLVPGLPELLHCSVLYQSEAHIPPIPQVRAVHKFVGALELTGKLHRVKFTVKELFDGKKLYDHQAVVVQENEADGNSPGTRLREEKLVTRPASASQINVAELFGDVNHDQRFIRCQIEEPGPGWEQDPDVLDTWFSSWLWPFATMGWPEQTPTLKAFYPTHDLVTAPEIIFFWVARMIMAGFEYMGELPFRNVYFTGIVRDKQGRKMSKSLGNSPDPLDLIAKYGADAIRFGTMRSAPLGQDVLFDEKDVELGRNFCNKLWNACRFRQMQGSAPVPGAAADAPPTTIEIQGEIDPRLLTSDDKWILLKLNDAIREITTSLAEYNFSAAVQSLYRFFWSEYCDWYVEASKAVFFGTDDKRKANTVAVIDFVLSHTLRMFHPFLPFITEELWHGMGYAEDMPEHQGGKTIMTAPWPKPFDNDFRDHYSLDDCYLEFANQKYEVVTQGRNLRRIGNIQAGKKVKFVLKPNREMLPHDCEVIKILLNAEALEITPDFASKKGTPTAHTPMGELFLPLEGLVDVEAEKVRLTKQRDEYQAEITKVEQKLANPNFTQKVPPQVLAEHQQRLTDWQAKLAHVIEALKAFES